MYFYLIGIDYKAAPFGQRENLWRDFTRVSEFWRSSVGPQGAVLLRTCNRIEIYGLAANADEAFAAIGRFKKAFADFFGSSYVKYTQREVLHHALRLACGLESQLKGELEITEQLRLWVARPDFPAGLKGLWEEVFSLSGLIRQASGLDKDIPNIAEIVFFDAEKFIGRERTAKIIVAGTGKIARLLAGHRPLSWQLQFVAHKNFSKAAYLAKESEGEVFSFRDLPQLLIDADVLISATASPHYILGKRDFEHLPDNRKQPLFIYDLALPRDIEPAVSENHRVFLQDLDDLAQGFQKFNQENAVRLRTAAGLIEEALESREGLVYGRNH